MMVVHFDLEEGRDDGDGLSGRNRGQRHTESDAPLCSSSFFCSALAFGQLEWVRRHKEMRRCVRHSQWQAVVVVACVEVVWREL